MTMHLTKMRLLVVLLIVLAVAGGAWHWWPGRQNTWPEGLVYGNGRIESDQVDVAAKSAGRVREMLAREGELVSAGQVLAHIDAAELQAERAKYQADLASQQASMLQARATVAQRQAELVLKEASLPSSRPGGSASRPWTRRAASVIRPRPSWMPRPGASRPAKGPSTRRRR
jgi:multidrug resistance efflux pump